MERFLDFFLTEKKLIFVFIPILIAVFLQFLYTMLKQFERGRTSGPENFFKTLDKKFDLDLVKNRNDITILRDSIARQFDTRILGTGTYLLQPT
jgi:hypothetical protein